MAGQSQVWVPVSAQMKGFVAQVVKEASGAADKGAKSLEAGFRAGGEAAGKAAADGLASQASQIEKISGKLAAARKQEATAAADVLTNESKLENLRKSGSASASQIARAEQQLESAKSRQADASAKVARAEADIETVRSGGKATALAQVRAEDALASARTAATTAVGKAKTAELQVDEAREKARQRADAVKSAEQNLINTRDRYGANTRETVKAEKELENAKKQSAAADNQLADASGKSLKARADLASANDNVKAKSMKLQAVQEDLARSEKAAGDAANQHEAELKALGKTTDDTADSSDRMAKVQDAVKVGLAAAGAAAVGAVGGLVKVATSFDDMYDTIRIGTGASDEAFEGLQDSARRVAEVTPAMDGGLEQIGTTLADLNTRLGLTGEPLETLTSQFIQLQNMGIDADINDVTGAFTQFGIAAADAPSALDDLFRISQATGRSITEITSNLSKSGPALQEFGFGLQESAGLLGALDKAGLDSEKTLGSMTKALGQFAKEGKNPQQALWGTIQKIDELTQAGKGAEAIDLANSIFGAKGGAGFVAAVQSGTFAYDDFMDSLGASSDTIIGVADETADFAESWQLFKQKAMLAIEPVATALFNTLAPAIEAGTEKFKEIVEWVKQFAQWARDNSAWLAPMVAGITTMAVAIGGVVAATKGWAAATAAYQTAVALAKGETILFNTALLANPLTWVAMAIAGVVAGLTVFFTKTETGRAVWEKLVGSFQAGVDKIKGFFTSLVDTARSAYNILFKGEFSGNSGLFGLGDESSKAVDFLFRIRDTAMQVYNILFKGDFKAGSGFFGLNDESSKFVNVLFIVRDTVIAVAHGVMTAFRAMGDAFKWVWESVIQPVWNGLVTVAKYAAAIVLTAVIAPLVIAWNGLSAAIKTGWENLVKPAWDAMQLAAQWMWTNVLQPVFGWIKAGWEMLVNGIKWAWENLLKPAWDALQLAAQFMWNSVLKPVWDAIKAAWEFLLNGIKFYWESVLKPAWDALQAAAQFMWNSVLMPTFGFIQSGWDALVNAIKWAWENILKPAWEALQAALRFMWESVFQPILGFIQDRWEQMGRGIQWVKDNVIQPVFDGLTSALDTLKGWFERTVDAIGRTWDTMKDKTASPIRWVVDTVYNNGIKKAWDNIAKFIGLEELPEVNLAFANGGVMPGYTPGRDVHNFVSPTGGRLALSGGEAIMRPEWTRAVGGPKAVDEMNSAARSGRLQSMTTQAKQEARANGEYANGGVLQAFANGGVVEAMTAIVQKKYPGMQMTSGYRAGDGGMHGAGLAGDFSDGTGNTPGMLSLANDIADTYPGSAELIHDNPSFDRNIKNGSFVGPFGQFYTMGQAGPHHHHVHWAMTVPPNLDFGGGVFQGGSDGSGGGGAASAVRGLVRSAWDKIINPIKDAIPTMPGMVGQVPKAAFETMTSKVWSWVSSKIPAGGSSGNGPGPQGGNVEQWRGLVEKVLKVKGQDLSLTDSVLRRMNQESGGDPGAINNWDSNAAAGTPSKGLMQVIDPTFAAHHDPGYDDIWDPESNIRASMNYAMAQYGSLPAAYDRAGGYDSGGYLQPGVTQVHNDSGKPEPVFSHDQWQDIKANILGRAEAQDWKGAIEEMVKAAELFANGAQKMDAAVEAQDPTPASAAAEPTAVAISDTASGVSNAGAAAQDAGTTSATTTTSTGATSGSQYTPDVQGTVRTAGEGIVKGQIEDALGVFGAPTELPPLLDAGQQLMGKITPAAVGAMSSAAKAAMNGAAPGLMAALNSVAPGSGMLVAPLLNAGNATVDTIAGVLNGVAERNAGDQSAAAAVPVTATQGVTETAGEGDPAQTVTTSTPAGGSGATYQIVVQSMGQAYETIKHLQARELAGFGHQR